MILSCNHVGKSFGTDTVLRDVSFTINDKEKVAIVGVNGAGKSTLLNLITGSLSPDDGDIALAKGTTLGYLTQRQDLTSDCSLWEETMDAKKEVLALDCSMRKLEWEMKEASGAQLEQKLNAYARLAQEFEDKNGYALRSEAAGILKGLGFAESEWERPVRNLSGGQKTRVALGKLLLSSPDFILLDEPTNHLDMASIAWLETYLSNLSATVLIVSHDRYFLNRIVTKLIEIENAKATTYLGNYEDYAKKKAKRREDELKLFQNQQNEIRHQEEVIAKLRSFNREKSIRRAQSREKLLSKMERLEKPATETPFLRIHLKPRITSGNDVLGVQSLSKSYGSLRLFSDLTFDIKRGERIALIGDNGTGKTTLLKLVNRLIEADSGEIQLGSLVKIAYYDQEHQVLSPKKTLFDELRDAYPSLDDTKLRNVLAAFLFKGDDAFKRVGDLSGGEKGRLSLAKLMLSEANFLLLDEPTNHLDVVSKELLEDAISSYEGTVFYVSHDRYFVNRTATGILHLQDGRLNKYIGNYDYFMEKSCAFTTAEGENGAEGMKAPAPSESASKTDWRAGKEEQARIRKLKNALQKAEKEIHELEQESEKLNSLMADPSVATNAAKLLEHATRKEEIEAALEELMETWTKLSEALD